MKKTIAIIICIAMMLSAMTLLVGAEEETKTYENGSLDCRELQDFGQQHITLDVCTTAPVIDGDIGENEYSVAASFKYLPEDTVDSARYFAFDTENIYFAAKIAQSYSKSGCIVSFFIGFPIQGDALFILTRTYFKLQVNSEGTPECVNVQSIQPKGTGLEVNQGLIKDNPTEAAKLFSGLAVKQDSENNVTYWELAINREAFSKYLGETFNTYTTYSDKTPVLQQATSFMTAKRHNADGATEAYNGQIVPANVGLDMAWVKQFPTYNAASTKILPNFIINFNDTYQPPESPVVTDEQTEEVTEEKKPSETKKPGTTKAPEVTEAAKTDATTEAAPATNDAGCASTVSALALILAVACGATVVCKKRSH